MCLLSMAVWTIILIPACSGLRLKVRRIVESKVCLTTVGLKRRERRGRYGKEREERERKGTRNVN